MAKKSKSFGKRTQQLVAGQTDKDETPVPEPVVPASDAAAEEPERFRTTIMMSDDAIELVEAIQRKHRRQHKQRLTKGEVYELAIKNLAETMGIKT